METSVLDIWRHSNNRATSTTVIPDGCRDLIMRKPAGEKPTWYISELFDKSEKVIIEAGDSLLGFRLRAGIAIDEYNLLASIGTEDIDEVQSRIDDFTSIDPSIEEALSCLSSNIKSVDVAARKLGVTKRTLQRTLIKKTNRTPLYWIMLSRARRAARDICTHSAYADTAYKNYYSDQAHLCREIKRWFNVTPSSLTKSEELARQFENEAYS